MNFEKRDREGIKDKVARAFLAQSVERAAFNRKVVGSRPTGGVFFQSVLVKESQSRPGK